jgi:S1-C subfamily serine protease
MKSALSRPRALAMALAGLLTFARLTAASIDGYSMIIVPPPNYGNPEIQQIIIKTVQKAGMTVVDKAPTGADATKTCLLIWSQHGELTQYCELRVKDIISGVEITRSAESSRIRFGIPANVVGSITDAWKALHYQGFNEVVHQANLKELFPERPTYALTEDEVKGMPLNASIEGIWADSENHYLLGIVADSRHQVDFVGVVLNTDSPIWHPGEIKLELRESASDLSYVGYFYRGDKQPAGVVGHFDSAGATLTFDVPMADGTKKPIVYIKTFPKSEGGVTASEIPHGGGWTGSGFLISGEGLIATNYHVAGQAHSLTARFPAAGKEYVGHVVLKDPNNDLAIVKLAGFSLKDVSQAQLPYGFERSKHVALGAPVYVIGYPLSDVMGQNPKFSNGTVNSKSGIGDDMVHLQISVPVQPGNSGSPLLDDNGNVVGIVVASLTQAQNVNYAIKADYLLNLCEMLPESLDLAEKSGKPKPDDVAPFVCLITAR